MKILPSVLLVGLLLAGCGSEKSVEDSLEPNQASADASHANANLEKIIAEAIVLPVWELSEEALEERGQGTEGKELRYAPDQQTPYTGWVTRMWGNGQINWLCQFKDGKKNGMEWSWWENGQKSGVANYKDGKEDGLWLGWHENGQKRSEVNFKNGKEDGLSTSWYDNGQKWNELNWKDGNQDGLATSWYLGNGRKHREETYKNGKEDGLSTSWYDNGQKWEEYIYKDGKVWSAFAWKPNGEKCPVTNVKNGNGVLVFYDVAGKAYGRNTLKNGVVVDYGGEVDFNDSE